MDSDSRPKPSPAHARPTKRLPLWWLGLAALAGLVGLAWPRAAVKATPQTQSVRVLTRTAVFSILPTGDVQVVETWQVQFIGGPFHYAYREFAHHHLAGLTDWQIAEGQQRYTLRNDETPYSFWVEDSADATTVRWYFPPTTDGVRTFTLRYTLQGVLWLDETGDEFFWNFLEAERGYPVEAVEAVVHLPADYAAEEVTGLTFRQGVPQEDTLTWLDAHTVVFRAQHFGPYEGWDVGVAWPHGAVTAAPPDWRKLPPEETTRAYQGAFVLDDQGRLHVTETWRQYYQSGPFSAGKATFARDGLDEITAWQMEIDGHVCQSVAYAAVERRPSPDAFCHFGVETDGVVYRAAWNFPETADAARTFQISYRVDGLVAQDRSEDTLGWTILDHASAQPYEAVWTVSLPTEAAAAIREAEAQVLRWEGSAALRAERPSQETWQWRTWIVPGDDVHFRLTWQHDALPLPLAAWQRRERQQQWWALGALVGAVLTGVIGVAAAVLIWYWRGRDPKVAGVPRWIPEAPSALSPGLVGVLLDEQADFRDVLATVWHLARQGFLEVEEAKHALQTTLTLKRPLEDARTLTSHEREVLFALFGQDAQPSQTVRVAALRSRLAERLSAIYRAMYADVVEAGLFYSAPDRVRQRGRWLVWGVAAFLSLELLVVMRFFGANQWLAWVFDASAILTLTAFWWLAKHLPRKTPLGAREAAQWRAFKRYLSNLKRFTTLESLRDQFEVYLPYATAFGLARNLSFQFARVPGATLPQWYRTAATKPVPAASSSSASRPEHSAAAAVPAGQRSAAAPELDLAAQAAFLSLADLSEDLFRALDTASGGSSHHTTSGGGYVTSLPSRTTASSSSSHRFSGGASGGGSSGFG